MSSADLKQLLAIIEQQLDWGEASGWQGRDFEMLNELILEKTKISLSASTLRRIWGRVEYNHLPSGTTLDTLARFAGFENWRAFTKQRKPVESAVQEAVFNQKSLSKGKSQSWLRVTLVLLAVIAIGMAGIYAKKAIAPSRGPYFFSSRPVTRTIPNSVVFTYDGKTNADDSLFFQQSWDPTTNVALDKENHQFTSIYYVPGVFHAKLLVNKKVVKEHLLMVPTDGWLGLIHDRPVPVYLDAKDFISPDGLQLPVSVIPQKNVPMGPQPPTVEYYNVGNFTPVPLKNFSFSAEIRNDYREGAAACQFVEINLYTDNTPVSIHLSAKGCVSDLRLLNGGYFVSGKNTDLSGFGADLSQWVKVSCQSAGDKIQYFVNDKMVYQSPLPLYKESIVGMSYGFQGTGSVRNIELKEGNKTSFKAF
jgi:hypothetical protein